MTITEWVRAKHAERACEAAFDEGTGTWRHILAEEFWEACAAVAWIEALDRRAHERAEEVTTNAS